MKCMKWTNWMLIASAAVLGSAGCADDTAQDFDEDPAADEQELGIAGCTFAVHDPHMSHHEPGNVNVVAKVECNRVVASIEMTIGLARDGVEIVSHNFSNAGKSWLQGTAAIRCVPGTYQGAAATVITFPFPSLPPSGTGNANSSRKYIPC